MRKHQIKGTVYVYDKATGKMLEKVKVTNVVPDLSPSTPQPVEGDPASGENDEAKRGESLDLSQLPSHGPWHTWEEMRAIADAVYPRTVDELQKALLEEAKKLSADNKKEERSLGTAPRECL